MSVPSLRRLLPQKLIDKFSSTQRTMDTLSIDVWQHIFKFACTDGGRTGAALSRTSKAVRNVAATYRFHSVQLNSLKQVQKFLTAYDAALADAAAARSDPPHVRHLLLTFLPGKTDMFVLGPSFHFMDFHSWQEEKVRWNEKFVDLVSRLFAHLAPGLVSMSVLQDWEILLPYVRATFPALRTLTLLQEDRMFFRATTQSDSWMEPSDKDFYSAGPPPTKDELAAAPIFPVLERLHLIEGKWDNTLPLWSVAAPKLSHLKVSSVKDVAYDALRATLAQSSNFQALRTLVISPQQSPKEAESIDAKIQAIRETAAARPKLEVVVLSGSNARYPSKWYDRLSEEWRSWAAGERWVTWQTDDS